MDTIKKGIGKIRKGIHGDERNIFVATQFGTGRPINRSTSATNGLTPPVPSDVHRSNSTGDHLSPNSSTSTFFTPLEVQCSGETAGQGYGYDDDQQYDGDSNSIIEAQKTGLKMAKQELAKVETLLHNAQKDERDLNEIMVDTYKDRLDGVSTTREIRQIEENIKELDNEIANLRLFAPQCIRAPMRPPPPVPKRTRSCAKCLHASDLSLYRCVNCKMTRPAIDPVEATMCRCVNCDVGLASRYMVSVVPGECDWMMVNKLNFS